MPSTAAMELANRIEENAGNPTDTVYTTEIADMIDEKVRAVRMAAELALQQLKLELDHAPCGCHRCQRCEHLRVALAAWKRDK